MDKIVFKNGEAPYISDENLNKMQENIEKAINKAQTDLNTAKVNKTTTIAGVNLQDNITATELVTALKASIVNLMYPVRKYTYICKKH